jgi:hypothetical protein
VPQTAREEFHRRFADHLQASDLSDRRVAREAGVGNTTLGGWKSQDGSLPQTFEQLLGVLRAAKVSTALDVGQWRALWRRATEERDADALQGRSTAGRGGPDPEERRERRARTIAATDRALDTLVRLRAVRAEPARQRNPTEPDPVRESWRDHRRELVEDLYRASLDIGDSGLKERLDNAVTVLRCPEGPLKHARQSEARSRQLAVHDAMESIGAFRRGDPLPGQQDDYLRTRDFVDIEIEEQELNSGWS